MLMVNLPREVSLSARDSSVGRTNTQVLTLKCHTYPKVTEVDGEDKRERPLALCARPRIGRAAEFPAKVQQFVDRPMVVHEPAVLRREHPTLRADQVVRGKIQVPLAPARRPPRARAQGELSLLDHKVGSRLDLGDIDLDCLALVVRHVRSARAPSRGAPGCTRPP